MEVLPQLNLPGPTSVEEQVSGLAIHPHNLDNTELKNSCVTLTRGLAIRVFLLLVVGGTAPGLEEGGILIQNQEFRNVLPFQVGAPEPRQDHHPAGSPTDLQIGFLAGDSPRAASPGS